MADSKPGGIVNHPWLVLLVFVTICFVGGNLGRPFMCGGQPPCRDTRAVADILVIVEAIETYALHHDGHLPVSIAALVTPDENGNRFLQGTRIPRDPWDREYITLPAIQ